MNTRNSLILEVMVYHSSISKEKRRRMSIDVNQLQELDSINSLLILISKEYQIDLKEKNATIELSHMGKWVNVIEIHSLLFFISSNILIDEPKRIRIKLKENSAKVDYEDEDMIKANAIDMQIYLDKTNVVKCGICHQSSDNDFYLHRLGPFYGPFKYSEQKYYIHLICALWCPKVCLSHANKLINVGKEVHRARREKCSYCGDTGAALGCWIIAEDSCSKKYHYLCAISDGCFFNRKAYGILCPKHRDNHIIPYPNEEVNYRKDAKKANADEETLVCSVCVLTCDQDRFFQCFRCKQYVHSYCDDYNAEQDYEAFSNDYLCSKCRPIN